MTEWFRAQVTKEIFFHGKTYSEGATVHLTKEDADRLGAADVIGDVEKMKEKIVVETATVEAPERAVRKRRPRSADG